MSVRVSCIMPTRNRPAFVAQAIRYFLEQDYPDKELVVVDDGEQSIAERIPEDVRIRYVRLGRRTRLGDKRNLGCEAATGELLAHWDDDDWNSRARLRRQVEGLVESGADLSGAAEVLHYRLESGDAWLYTSPRGAQGLVGGTLLFRRSLWEAAPFASVDVGEDSAFVRRVAGRATHLLGDRSLYVALLHPGNTAAKNLADRAWSKLPLDEVSRLIGEDWPFYAELRHERVGKAMLPRVHLPDDGTMPLVSCVMPTRDRRHFVRQSIDYFLRQDYPNRELVIVDDGVDSVADLVTVDRRIRYRRISRRESVGAKRNVGCEMARGKVVLLWDDDDWYGPDRIRRQVEPLRARSAEVTGYGPSHFLSLPDGAFWTCTRELQRRLCFRGLLCGTIAFPRAYFERGARFPDSSQGEDKHFVQTLLARGARSLEVPAEGAFVCVRHGANTWAMRPGTAVDQAGWREVPRPWFLPDGDLAFYLGERAAAESLRAALPLASCILPCGARPAFIPHAIECFARQSYPNKQLVVVYDGSASIDRFVPANSSIRLVQVPPETSIGAKLNAGIEAADGDILQRLDDDDYYHPDFLASTVRALLARDPERTIVGFDEFPVLLAGSFDVHCSGSGWLAGATLCFHRGLWKRFPFRACNHGEDTDFLHESGAEAVRIAGTELYVCVRHGRGHTWQRCNGLPVTEVFRRKPKYPRSIRDLLPPEDLAFYETLRGSSAA